MTLSCRWSDLPCRFGGPKHRWHSHLHTKGLVTCIADPAGDADICMLPLSLCLSVSVSVCLSVCLCLSLSLSLSHTHTHTCTLMYVHTHMHTLKHACTHALTHTHPPHTHTQESPKTQSVHTCLCTKTSNSPVRVRLH